MNPDVGAIAARSASRQRTAPTSKREALMTRYSKFALATTSLAVVVFTTLGAGQDQAKPKVGYKDTPMLPGGRG
jgi:hypothetical protein